MLKDKLQELYEIKSELKDAVSYVNPDTTVTDRLDTYPALIHECPNDRWYAQYFIQVQSGDPVHEQDGTSWAPAAGKCVFDTENEHLVETFGRISL